MNEGLALRDGGVVILWKDKLKEIVLEKVREMVIYIVEF